MELVWYVLIYVALILVCLAWIMLSDRKWYRDYPGMKEYFARVDDELTAKGQ